MAKAETDAEMISIGQIQLETIKVPIIGTSELLVHRWSEEALRDLEESMTKGKSKTKIKAPRNPEHEYEASKYKTADGKEAIPTVAFKVAMVDACRHFKKSQMNMTLAKSSVFVLGDFAVIEGESYMRKDPVSVGRGRQIRYRAAYPKWKTEIYITYATSVLDRDGVLAMITAAGLTQGVGDWRPSSPKKPGTKGMFKIDPDRQIEMLEAV